jgi:hypothetical protein
VHDPEWRAYRPKIMPDTLLTATCTPAAARELTPATK